MEKNWQVHVGRLKKKAQITWSDINDIHNLCFEKGSHKPEHLFSQLFLKQMSGLFKHVMRWAYFSNGGHCNHQW